LDYFRFGQDFWLFFDFFDYHEGVFRWLLNFFWFGLNFFLLFFYNFLLLFFCWDFFWLGLFFNYWNFFNNWLFYRLCLD
jgi:hypothetical protein